MWGGSCWDLLPQTPAKWCWSALLVASLVLVSLYTLSWRHVPYTGSSAPRWIPSKHYRIAAVTNVEDSGSDDTTGYDITTASLPPSITVPDAHVSQVNCAAIFEGDEAEIARARSLGDKVGVAVSGEWTIESLKYLLKSCKQFRKKRQYSREPLSEEESDFPLAFSILTYTDSLQLERLLRAIYQPQNYYCIHVDAKAEQESHSLVQSLSDCLPNVVKASTSVDVEWGYYSVLEPELVCMRELLRYTKWRYFINLTGQEFPLKTNLELVRIMKALNGSNDMEGVLKGQNDGDHSRTKYVHIPGWGQIDKLKTPPPAGVNVIKGAVHITAQRGFVEFALQNDIAQRLNEWLKNAAHPDEIFFATLNYNPKLGTPGAYLGDVDKHNTKHPFLSRYKEWQWYGYKCQGKWVRSLCVFGVGDLHHLSSRPHLFANKFHQDFEPLAYDCMEEKHYNNTKHALTNPTNFDINFYRELDTVKNHVV